MVGCNFNTPGDVASLLNLLNDIPFANVLVRNYSVCSKRLSTIVAEWLELKDVDLTEGIDPHAVVNRSLTAGELEFQRVLNSQLGSCGELCGRVVSGNLPSLETELIVPSLQEQQVYIDRVVPQIRVVNSLVEREHQYQ